MAGAESESVAGGELEVLKVLWEGPATVREVLDALRAKGRDLAYNTVQTVLNRLQAKGVATRRRVRGAFVYRARVEREQVVRSRVGRIVEELYEGVAGGLVLEMVEGRQLAPDELERLQKLIDDLSRKKKGGRR